MDQSYRAIQKSGCNINFLDLLSVINCMPRHWKNQITSEEYEDHVYTVEKLPLTCKCLYNELINKSSVYPERYVVFWQNELNVDIDELDWFEDYMDVFSWTVSTKLRSFLYQIRMGDIMCNLKLFKMKKRDNSDCDWCNNTRQDISHLFWDCPIVTDIWLELSGWINSMLDCYLVIKKELVFLHDIEAGNYTRIINLIILICCRYIYIKKCLNETPHFQGVMKKVQETESIERGISIRTNKFHLHRKKWCKFSKNVN